MPEFFGPFSRSAFLVNKIQALFASMIASPILVILQAAIVDPVDPDSVVAAIEEEGVSKVLEYCNL